LDGERDHPERRSLGDDAGFINNSVTSYHVVIGASNDTLDGFTILGVNVKGIEGWPYTYGGGLRNSSARSRQSLDQPS
jgi:hypothetical protein